MCAVCLSVYVLYVRAFVSVCLCEGKIAIAKDLCSMQMN